MTLALGAGGGALAVIGQMAVTGAITPAERTKALEFLVVGMLELARG